MKKRVGSTLSGFSENSQVDLDEITGFAADADENLYVTGYSDAAGNGDDIVTLMLDDTLGLVWESVYNGSANGDDRPSSLDIDTLGNVYVGGYATGSNGRDFTVIKYNNSGTQQWAELYDGASHGDDEAKAVVAGKDGLVYVTGSVDTLGQKDYHTRLLKASDGTTEWSTSFNGLHSKDDEAASITLDGEGGLSVLGKNGLSNGKTEYMLVRYAKKQLTIPPGDGAASPALAFTEQQGQLTDTSGTSAKGIRFYSTGNYPPLYVQDDKLSFVTASVDTSKATPDTLHRVDITFFDSKTSLMSAAGLDKLDNYRNYYLGHIPEGRARVGQYGRVAVTNLYDGINLQMFADESGIVYYFVIQPGGDPDDIELEFNGQDALSLNGSKLQVGTSVGSFDLPAPSAFQINSQGQEVSTTWSPAYSITGNRVSFSSTGAYDSGKVLVIELRRGGATAPGLTGNLDWCTYIGGSASGSLTEHISKAAVDGEDLYLLGLTNNLDFPIETGAINNFSGSRDAVLLRFTTEGVLEWGTFYGGSGPEEVQAVLPSGENVYLGGSSGSSDLPILASGPNAYTNSNLGAGGFQGCLAMFESESGSLSWSTYFGDSADGNDQVLDIAKNPNNSNIMVAGTSDSGADFPLLATGTGFYESSGNGFLSEFDGENDLVWSTKFGSLGNTIRDIEYDSQGNLFLTGSDFYSLSQPDPLPVIGSGATYTQSNSSDNVTDAIIAKIDTDRELEWSTFFGGLGWDVGISLAISSDDKVYLAGDTDSGNSSSFPLLSFSSGAYYDDSKDGDDLFIARFSNEGVQEWTTFFGGSSSEFFPSVTFDAADNVVVIGGNTQSTDIVANSPDPSLFEQEDLNANNQSDQRDGFLVTFDENLIQGWTTYFGGYGTNGGQPRDALQDIEFGNGALFMVGSSGADNPRLPVQAPGGGAYYQPILAGESGVDGFIAKFSIDGGTITSTEDRLISQNFFTVFPNPFDENIDVLLTNGEGSLSQFRVYDVLGRVLLEGASHSTRFQVPLSHLPKQAYFLELQNNGKRGVRKLVKQ